MVSGSQRRRRCEWCENRYANIKLTNARNVTSEFLSAACEAIFTWVSSSNNKNNFFEGCPLCEMGSMLCQFCKPATNRNTYQGPRVPIPCPPRQSGLERIAWFDPQITANHLVVLSKGSRNSWWFCWEEISISCPRRFSNLGRFLPFGQLRVKDLKNLLYDHEKQNPVDVWFGYIFDLLWIASHLNHHAIFWRNSLIFPVFCFFLKREKSKSCPEQMYFL